LIETVLSSGRVAQQVLCLSCLRQQYSVAVDSCQSVVASANLH